MTNHRDVTVQGSTVEHSLPAKVTTKTITFCVGNTKIPCFHVVESDANAIILSANTVQRT